MKKKHLANLVMVAVIAVIAAAGILAAGNILGWFDSGADAALLTDVRGVVTMDRGGVAYPVEDETVLREGDVLTCDAGASAVIRLENGFITLGSAAQTILTDPSRQAFSAEVLSGEVFVGTETGATLSFDGHDVIFENASALLSVRAGAQTISVFEGVVESASAGRTLDWVRGSLTVGEVNIHSLNDFAIAQIRKANETRHLCISNEDLDALEAQRIEAVGAQLVSGNADGLYCTIAIYCDTILDNWDNLDTAKASFVPQDGVVLKPVTVEFTEGETVFDVLQRVCEVYDIQIEYSWTPMYDSYYVEGIHNLYEFDCGFQSGWMYKVNEWFPNYGCSSYSLTGGESIVWCYTCNGLGEDVGGSGY